MHYWGKTLPSIVRYLIGIVRDRDGLLGLVEDRGSEYWMTTVIPVRSATLGPTHQYQSHSPSYHPQQHSHSQNMCESHSPPNYR